MRRAILASAVLALAGCRPISTSVTPLVPGPFAARPEPCELAVMTEAPRDRPYQELALIHGLSAGPLTDLLPALKAEGCKLGADAIIIRSTTLGQGKQLNQATVVAIRFR